MRDATYSALRRVMSEAGLLNARTSRLREEMSRSDAGNGETAATRYHDACNRALFDKRFHFDDNDRIVFRTNRP